MVDFSCCKAPLVFWQSTPALPKGFWPMRSIKPVYIGCRSERVVSTASMKGRSSCRDLDRVMILVKERSGFWIHSVIYLCLCGIQGLQWRHAVFSNRAQGGEAAFDTERRDRMSSMCGLWPDAGACELGGLSCPPCPPPRKRLAHPFLLF